MPKWFIHFFIPTHRNTFRPHLLRNSWLLVLVGVVVLAESALIASLMLRGSDFFAAVIKSEVIALTNSERESANLGAVQENPLLTAAAQAKANDMAAKGYFAHVAPDGTEPWVWIKKAGYRYRYAGENLAVRFVDSKEVVNAWMHSPSHRENIVKPQYREVGIGIAEGFFQGQPSTYVVQFFATPPPVAVQAAPVPVVKETEAAETKVKSEPQVAGVQTANAAEAVVEPPVSADTPQSGSFIQASLRYAGKILSEPYTTTGVILGLVGTLAFVLIVLTFFVRIQVQPKDMLTSGALVAGLAFTLWWVNGQVFATPLSQTAAVGVVYDGGVLLTPSAMSTEQVQVVLGE